MSAAQAAPGADRRELILPLTTDRRRCLRDIAGIWDWSLRNFGHAVALRYESLIDQALGDIAEDPRRPGEKPRPDLLPDLWLHHIAASRNHVPAAQQVKSPRHLILFRHMQATIIDIVRTLHESRDLPRHLPEE